jgi:hypothetical protein
MKAQIIGGRLPCSMPFNVEIGGKVAHIAPKSVCHEHCRISLRGGRVSGRKNDDAAHVNRPSPEGGQRRADKVQRSPAFHLNPRFRDTICEVQFQV